MRNAFALGVQAAARCYVALTANDNAYNAPRQIATASVYRSETATSQLSTESSLSQVVVTCSAPTSQVPPQVLTVRDAPPKTPLVADALSASARINKPK